MGKFRPPVEEPKPQVEEVKEETVEAVIDNCECLNIRKEPELKANNQIAILGKGIKIVVVDPKKPVKNKEGEWYKIRLFDADPKDPTKNGYAKKEYIKIV